MCSITAGTELLLPTDSTAPRGVALVDLLSDGWGANQRKAGLVPSQPGHGGPLTQSVPP
jgi:hypothetical protein